MKSANKMKGMKGVIVRDIKRKTSIPESVIRKAVEYAYSIDTPQAIGKPIRIIPG